MLLIELRVLVELDSMLGPESTSLFLHYVYEGIRNDLSHFSQSGAAFYGGPQIDSRDKYFALSTYFVSCSRPFIFGIRTRPFIFHVVDILLFA